MYKISDQPHGITEIGNVNLVLNLKKKQIIQIDERLLRFLGNPQTLDFATFKPLIHEQDLEVVQLAYQKLQRGEIVGMVKFRVLVEKEVVWIGLTPFLYHKGEDLLLLANVIMITAEVENLQTALKFANKKDSILQMISHDLRGPLGIANSIISVLNKENLSPESLQKTQAISDIISQTIKLIGDLTDKEFLETVDAPLVMQRLDLVKKLSEYIEQCKRFEEVNERTFTLTASSEQIMISLDEGKFMQVMNNLITNALKFTRTDGNISISLEERDHEVIMVFKDDGIGIPEQLLPYIFDRYTIAKRTGLHGESTTGLGLFIVKEIVSWHNGEIACESQEGVGTTFTIKLAKYATDH